MPGLQQKHQQHTQKSKEKHTIKDKAINKTRCKYDEDIGTKDKKFKIAMINILNALVQELANFFSVKGHIVNILGPAGHMVSVTTFGFCHCSTNQP